MKHISWWSVPRQELKVLIDQWVAGLGSAFPPELEASTTGRAKSLRHKGVDALLAEVDSYALAKAPGFFGRLMLGRYLQQQLIAAGYSAGFSRQVTTAALAGLTRPTRS